MAATSMMRRRKLGGILLVLGTLGMLAGVFLDPVAAASVTPTAHTGNQTCGTLGYASEVKLDAAAPWAAEYWKPKASDASLLEPGTSTDYLIRVFNDESDEFDFSLNPTHPEPVSAVFVKFGNGGLLYNYLPTGTYGDSDLFSDGRQISHVSFCFGSQATTTTTEATTTTTEATTTTTQATTTTTQATTTTTAPATTTTTSTPVVLVTTTVQETTTTTEAPTTTTTVADTTTTSAARVLGTTQTRTLASTGVDDKLVFLSGLALFLGGLAFTFGEPAGARRRI